MNSSSIFQLHDIPIERTFENVNMNALHTLLASGVVNPFGPTITAFVLEGDFESEEELPILHLSLNPFSQDVEEIGFARIGDFWDPSTDLEPLFELISGPCPTLLLPSAMYEHEVAVDVYARYLSAFDEGFTVLEEVRRFPGDPWNRVQEEVDGGLKNIIRDSRSGEGANKKNRRLNEEEALELAQNLLTSENLKKELQAFMFAWRGAIEFQGGSGMSDMTMSPKEFADQFALLAMSCNLPEM